MEPQIWQTFLALVTYAQLVDDLERGDAKMTPQYQGSVVAAFGVGFGPPHLWQAMQGDTSKFALRIIDRWFMDEDYRAAGGSLCWQFIDWFAPGFCAISKGLEAKQQCLQILKEIKQDFV